MMTIEKLKFLKRIRPKQKQEMRELNQKTMNRLFIGGLLLIIGLATLSIIASLTRSTKPQTIVKEVNQSGTTVNYRLEYFLSDYISSYFNLSEETSEQSDQIEKLNSFYDVVPEIKSQGLTRLPSILINAELQTIEKNVATYQVTYKVGGGDDQKEITSGFAIPFAEKKNQYYISGLPWYVTLTSTKATGFSSNSGLKLVEDTETSRKAKEKLDTFLNLFFTNYTSNQENLDLIANNLVTLENTEYKSLDYSYYKHEKDDITAYVQVTFEIAGNTHCENFTITLTKKSKSFYVQKFEHTIDKDYTKKTSETGETK